MTTTEIAEDEALINAATEGPWHRGQGRSEVLCEDGILDADGGAVSVHCGRGSGVMSIEDEEFTVAARTRWPLYVAEVKRLMKRDEPVKVGDGGRCPCDAINHMPPNGTKESYCWYCGKPLEWS